MEECVSQLRTLRLRSTGDVSMIYKNSIFSTMNQSTNDPLSQWSSNHMLDHTHMHAYRVFLHAHNAIHMNACPQYHRDNNDCDTISPLPACTCACLQLVSVSDMQQRVSGAVNDFKSLSQEVMVTLRYSGKGKRSRRRRHDYRVFIIIILYQSIIGQLLPEILILSSEKTTVHTSHGRGHIPLPHPCTPYSSFVNLES